MTGPSQLPLDIRLPETASFDTFHPGPNAAAFDAIRQLAGEDRGGMLYLQGPQGSGKTHLLQAACRSRTLDGDVAVYLPLSEHADDTAELLDGLHGVPLICLDDVDAIQGHGDWVTGLVALYDAMRSAGHVIIAASRQAPTRLEQLPADLVSRFRWGLPYALAPLDDTDRIEAIKLRALQRGITLSDEVARYLMGRYPRDMHSLSDAVDALDRASLQAQRRLTIPFAREVLGL